MKSIPAFGIDVYATPFPHNRGYKIYPGTSQANLLLIRLEDLKECVEQAMQEFLGLKDFSLYNTNTTSEKDFAELYRAFNQLPFPAEYVEERYKTQFARHFYSDEELDNFTKRWTKSAEIANNASYREKQFAEMQQSVKILAAQVVEKSQSVRTLTAQVAALEKLTSELSDIKASKVWEVATFLRRMQLKAAPLSNLFTKGMRRFTNVVILPFLRIANKQNTESDLALLRSSDLFDAAWYVTNNHEVIKKHMDPALHYLWYGGFQGRDPGPNFSSSWYLENNKDVKKARVNPLVHYLRNGKQEGRKPQP